MGGNTMSDKDIELLIELANAKLDKGVSKQEALNSLINAGILNNEGTYTEPYKELEEIAL
jgi:hypothetical protein